VDLDLVEQRDGGLHQRQRRRLRLEPADRILDEHRRLRVALRGPQLPLRRGERDLHAAQTSAQHVLRGDERREVPVTAPFPLEPTALVLDPCVGPGDLRLASSAVRPSRRPFRDQPGAQFLQQVDVGL
jgi:hypothetical protein